MTTTSTFRDVATDKADLILGTARALFLEHGLRRTSLADIARASHLSESTLYRRFTSREALLAALVSREAERTLAEVNAEIAHISDPTDRIIGVFIAVAKVLRSHDLISRLMTTDPDQILPMITVHGSDMLNLGKSFVQVELQAALDAGRSLALPPEYLAEVLVRFAHSLLLTPDTAWPVDDDAELRTVAHALISGLIAPPAEANSVERR